MKSKIFKSNRKNNTYTLKCQPVWTKIMIFQIEQKSSTINEVK